jgi:hypothetical protein
MVHPSSQPLTNHPLVFAEYAASETWVAAHIGQFAGVMLVFAGGFVALHPLLAGSKSGTAKALALLGWLRRYSLLVLLPFFRLLMESR